MQLVDWGKMEEKMVFAGYAFCYFVLFVEKYVDFRPVRP